jgi:hypothetical protein
MTAQCAPKVGALGELLIPQRFKKCSLNLWVKLRFFKSTGKPTSYTLHPP